MHEWNHCEKVSSQLKLTHVQLVVYSYIVAVLKEQEKRPNRYIRAQCSF